MRSNNVLTGLDVADAALPMLRTRMFGRRVQAFEQTSSTNAVAAEWASTGAPEGSLVVAEYQTAGRGRMGRSWLAAKGQNLMFSLVLRPTLAVEEWGMVTLAAAAAIAEAVDRFISPLHSSIKWPNDILLNGRKCCGVLIESAYAGATSGGRSVILGVGLNVNQEQFDVDLAGRATSLLLETGRFTHRSALLADLLFCLETHYTAVNERRFEQVRRAFCSRLHRLGETVTYRLAEGRGSIRGTLEGITDLGALRLNTEHGVRTFHAGELTTQPE
jgi:BirA family transcriptional regulator, biotin operon repressor / biotin---[acetyl-CoA-carboxylase] ligase